MKKTNSLNNEDIKILKEFIKIDRNMRNNSTESDYDKFCERRCVAIENLLNKLEENENQDYTLIYMKGYADAEEKYRQKIKEKIEELKNEQEQLRIDKNVTWDSQIYKLDLKIQILQELLQESEDQ